MFEESRRPTFDAFYKSKGWTIERINAKGYDGIISSYATDTEGKTFCINNVKIEEKASHHKNPPYICVELIQDVKTGSPGWIKYIEAEYLFYLYQDNTLYQVKVKDLKEYVDRHGHTFKVYTNNEGWGQSEYLLIHWGHLISLNICRKVQ